MTIIFNVSYVLRTCRYSGIVTSSLLAKEAYPDSLPGQIPCAEQKLRRGERCASVGEVYRLHNCAEIYPHTYLRWAKYFQSFDWSRSISEVSEALRGFYAAIRRAIGHESGGSGMTILLPYGKDFCATGCT